MNFVIIGNNAEELAWAKMLMGHDRHRLVAAFPGFADHPDLPGRESLESALALEEVGAAIIGGDRELRCEGLNRAAISGLAAICLHPPSDVADPYYVVELGRHETGAVVVPDTAARRHPGIAKLQAAIVALRSAHENVTIIRYDAVCDRRDGDILTHVFPRAVDLIRSLIGQVEDVTAVADPPDGSPLDQLVVQMRGRFRGEVRLTSGAREPARLSVVGSASTLTLEFEPDRAAPARLLRKGAGKSEIEEETFPEWDPREMALDVLESATEGRAHSPNLNDGMRSLEILDATSRSFRRGRTIQLHFEEISEVGSFKAFMTSAGCGLLVLAIVALPIALLGPVLGFNGTLVIAYAIPPLLILFLLLQFLRLLARGPQQSLALDPEDQAGLPDSQAKANPSETNRAEVETSGSLLD